MASVRGQRLAGVAEDGVAIVAVLVLLCDRGADQAVAFVDRGVGVVRRRCERCGSYDVRGGRCGHCGWVDESYTPPPEPEPLTEEEELTERLAEPCTPSSDISTFMRPQDVA